MAIIRTKVVTSKNTRWSYVHVFKPYDPNGNEASAKYSVCLIIPKSDSETINKIKLAIRAAYQDGEAKLKGNNGKLPSPESLRNPLHDGDLERQGDEVYKNSFYLNAKASKKPGVVDTNLNDIIDEEEVYSGCYGRASITFYAYNFNGNKGIACSLNNLQKVKDGERLSGKPTAKSDFANADDLFEDEDILF
ncbi:MAG TPA: DUF2815 domain-containing protein [Firmicutes bacterium]|nr:DUF2815 domain-containing protein [Bacillota bacterium]